MMLLPASSLDFDKDRGMVLGSIFRGMRIFGFGHSSLPDKKKPFVKDRMDLDMAAKAAMSQILNSIPQSVSWKNREGVFLGCNEGFCPSIRSGATRGYNRKNGLRSPMATRRCGCLSCRRSGGDEKRESQKTYYRASPAGRWSVVSGSIFPRFRFMMPMGRIMGVLGIFDDITE